MCVKASIGNVYPNAVDARVDSIKHMNHTVHVNQCAVCVMQTIARNCWNNLFPLEKFSTDLVLNV